MNKVVFNKTKIDLETLQFNIIEAKVVDFAGDMAVCASTLEGPVIITKEQAVEFFGLNKQVNCHGELVEVLELAQAAIDIYAIDLNLPDDTQGRNKIRSALAKAKANG